MTLASTTNDVAEHDRRDDLQLTDFTANSPDFGWYTVNDSVMGGRSDGDFESHRGSLHFAGRTNTNGGGFSSIRTRSLNLDLADFSGVRLTVRGDGRRYTWRLTTKARWRGRTVSYWADYETREGELQTIDIPFSGFTPRFRGYQLEGPALDPEQITGMGLMIYDGQDGPFELELTSVSAYADSKPFELTEYRWNRRVLVLSAASLDDPALIRQQQELALTQLPFESRDMVLVTLVDGPAASVDGRALSSAEVSAARAKLGLQDNAFAIRLIGKDGSVKLSRDTATSMADIYALIDTMPMRQAEVACNCAK